MPELVWPGEAARATFRVISGGQTGVDRGGLDAAMELGIPTNGFCPKGRISEDGPIPDKYVLRELPTDQYPPRTRANVRASDGTLLVVTQGKLGLGSKLTMRSAMDAHKPLITVNLNRDCDTAAAIRWIEEQGIGILNIAGPRESSAPGIQASSKKFLSAFFKEILLKRQ